MPRITVGTTPTLLATAKPASRRGWITLALERLNAAGGEQAADARIGVGDAAVTATTGHLLRRGFGMTLENDTHSRPATKAIYGIVAAGSVEILVDEGL